MGIYEDYLKYFTNAKEGDVTNTAGGTLTRTASGATYSNPTTGESINLTPTSDLAAVVAAAPSIGSTWKDVYGEGALTSPGLTGGMTISDIVNEQGLTGLGPSSTSKSTSSSGGSSSSSQFSGLSGDVRKTLEGTVTPALQAQIEKLVGMGDRSTAAALNKYKSMTRSAMEDTLPAVLESLSAKNMNLSSMTPDMISNAMAAIAKTYGDKTYDAVLASAGIDQNSAQILGQLAELLKYTKGSSKSAQSSSSQSESEQKDTLAPAKLVTDLLLNY